MRHVQGKTGAVLVADDEPMIRMVLGMAIKKRGHELVVAASGHDMLTQLRTRDFDLIIMDASMPGPALADRLKWLQDSKPATPVVVLSGHTFTSEFATGPATRFLTKPLKLDLLNQILDDVTVK